MTSTPVGLPLYTLQERLAENLPDTLADIRRIGFETVELTTFHGQKPADFATLLRDVDLRCRSAHIPA